MAAKWHTFFDGIFLYGTALGAGANNKGTIFKIKPDGTGFIKLLDFDGASKGSWPFCSFIFDGTFLYGTTYYGGTNDLGVIFKIMPDGTNYTKLFDCDSLNGRNPYGSLIYDGTFLYGMTYKGGVYDKGVIFKLMPDGTNYSKLLDFNGANGQFPWYTSLLKKGSFLYGMTWSGGANGQGVLFKIKTDGTGYSNLYDFTVGEGRNPMGSLISDSSFLYGMARNGGINENGTIFKFQDTTTTQITENNQEVCYDIYPNPSFGIFTIIHANNFKNIEVHNVLGEDIFHLIPNHDQTTIEINITNVPKGIYFVKLDNGVQSHIKKLIIN